MESLDVLLEEGFEPPAIAPEAGHLFDREWGLNLVESTLVALEEEFGQDAQSKATFSVLKRFLPGAELRLSSADAAGALGVPIATAKTWVHRLRQRFRERLRSRSAPRTRSTPNSSTSARYSLAGTKLSLRKAEERDVITGELICRACGAMLDPERSAGMCAACLISGALDDMLKEEPLGDFGGHELLEVVAHGGMGIVYRARQREPRREVALKTLHVAELRSPEARARFRAEIRVLAEIEHPAILPFYQCGVFLPGSPTVATLSGEAALKFWDLRSGRLLLDLPASPGSPTNDLVASPDGRLLLAAGEDGRLRVWEASR